jgi:integral membrane protein (TIGR01906 family)
MRALGVCLVSLWLLLASFMVVLSPPVTHLLAEQTVDMRNSQLSSDYLVRIADDTRAYCAGLAVELPLGSDERLAFTPAVMAHLDDVRTVFVACQWAAALLTLALAGYLLAIRRRALSPAGKKLLSQVLALGALIPLVLVALLAVIGFLSFDLLFSSLHRVLFAEGSWLFASDSLLIRALPEPFWLGCAIVWALSLLLLGAITLLLALRLRRR